MNTDHHFVIGKTHKVCEDYSISGEVDGIHYAIVCDGCSSSPDTDIGARILARAAVKHIAKSNNNMMFAELVMATAEFQAKSMGLSSKALDATIVSVAFIDGNFHINMYGDGAFHHQTKGEGGCGETIIAKYEKSMPYYPSYLLSKKNSKDYWEIFKDSDGPESYESYIEFEDNDLAYAAQETRPWWYRCYWGKITDFIAVMSDGIESFNKKVDSETSITSESCETIDIVKELVSFKNFKGDFVKRRMIRALKNFECNGIYHNDDLSLAVICNK